MALALALGLAAGMAGCGNQSAPSSRQASSGPVSETMNPYNLHQVVAENNEKGRTIMWELPSGKDNSLEYRKKGTHTVYTVPASGKPLEGNRGIKTVSYIRQSWIIWKRENPMSTEPGKETA